ncbi:D-alanine--D-alanine ligase [Marinilabilia rubra]|uniref:D-alanine--D-alanine ligase n=1 Tax=Marinilabilia rubra TaxID=2162893 RepID=A0A2U2B8C4_9BACT|nr:D-alanine--D-alanine ligase [Marinilabilia rubra]PWD99296.1 D-alanine--D-alanine ligase [Marinilabilia rubra]
MKNVGIIYGGYSSELVVSRKSAEGIRSFIDPSRYNVFSVLITDKKWVVTYDDQEIPIDKNDFTFIQDGERINFDCLYITIHGTPGEDGLLQGYLKMLGIPHTTSDVLPAALTFNKFTCNTYLKGFGVAVADSILLRKGREYNSEDIIGRIGIPCFVKPNAGGSSFGISKVKTPEELAPAFDKAFEESNEALVEGLMEGTEVTCGIYKTTEKEVVMPLTEVISKNEFFDFEAKYNAEKAIEITPARISDELTEKIQKITSLIYDILNCKGIVRVDYIITDKKIFMLEVNTTPGMTPTSFIPQQVEALGMTMQEVITDIIEDAIERG